MSKAIVAIGGGDIRRRGTAAIDREIIRLSGKTRPKLLFIPTASYDAEEYWAHVQKYFGGFLRCKAEVLFLIRERPPHEEIRRKILAADVIYVGGGNTLKMIRLWRRLEVDRLLRLAYKNGTVLSGISAGAICWFDSGHSDSMSFYNPQEWRYINVRGMGLLPGMFCPHYNSGTLGKARRKSFRGMIGRIGGVGIGLENNCAIEVVDGRFYKIIRSKPVARAYRVCKQHGEVVVEQIPQTARLQPLASLFDQRRG